MTTCAPNAARRPDDNVTDFPLHLQNCEPRPRQIQRSARKRTQWRAGTPRRWRHLTNTGPRHAAGGVLFIKQHLCTPACLDSTTLKNSNKWQACTNQRCFSNWYRTISCLRKTKYAPDIQKYFPARHQLSGYYKK